MKLFYTPGACSMIPHLVLEEIGQPYETHLVNFMTGDQLKPEYLAINPAGRVPALATDEGVLTEIPAILGYLARRFPNAGLAPLDDLFAFADMQAFHMYIATNLHVLFRQISRPEFYADGEACAAALRAKVPEMSERYFGLIEQKLADGRPWVHGRRYTMSDPYLFVFSCYLNDGNKGDQAKLPHVVAHRRRVAERPAVRKVLADEGLPDFAERSPYAGL